MQLDEKVKNCQILDTTIRDGSYAVNFKFTQTDVKNVVVKLVKLGIRYIEIGHGLGLNASGPVHGESLCTDEEYIDAAKEVSEDSQLGMFCIPGIARLDDLTKAYNHGISFVRIGVPVEKTTESIPFIIKSKKLGLIVMVNFMKSYSAQADEFANSARMVHESGADYVYLVDSAGYMLPDEIESLYDASLSVTPELKLGFHGHNNLGIAVANSIRCAELGFSFVDTSFQGLGRSLGNTPTEQYVMTLKRKFGDGIIDMDIPRLLEYGYIALKEITDRNLDNPLDLVCGYSGFHSSFVKDVYKCCAEVGVDPLRLIIAYSKIDKVHLDQNKLYNIASSLPEDKVDEHPYNFRNFFSNSII